MAAAARAFFHKVNDETLPKCFRTNFRSDGEWVYECQQFSTFHDKPNNTGIHFIPLHIKVLPAFLWRSRKQIREAGFTTKDLARPSRNQIGVSRAKAQRRQGKSIRFGTTLHFASWRLGGRKSEAPVVQEAQTGSKKTALHSSPFCKRARISLRRSALQSCVKVCR